MAKSEETKQKIKAALAETKSRRKGQICKVIEIKINESYLSNAQREFFEMLFVERKRFYNHIISFLNSTDDSGTRRSLKDFDSKITTIQYCVPNFDSGTKVYVPVDYEIRYLTAQMKQGIVNDIKTSIESLKTNRSKGRKVWSLHYAKECNSVSITQYKMQYEIMPSGKLRFAIPVALSKQLRKSGQKFKHIRVHGVDQITKEMELTSAKLIRKASGLYLHITTFQKKVAKTPRNRTAGADFGIKMTLTINDLQNDVQRFNIRFPETEKLKRIQRKMDRQVKTSKNRRKTKQKFRKEHEHITNTKDNAANQIIAALKKKYDNVVYQDDSFSSWKNTKGKAKVIQNSILGRLKSGFKKNGFTKVERKAPTTRLCHICLTKTPCPLGQDLFKCSCCGFTDQRDDKAAKTTLLLGQELIVFDKSTKTYAKSLSFSTPGLATRKDGSAVDPWNDTTWLNAIGSSVPTSGLE